MPVKPAMQRKWAREYAKEKAIKAGCFAFELPLPPSANDYWRTTAAFNPRTRKHEVRTYVTHEARAYKTRVAEIARRQGVQVLAGHVSIRLRVFRPAKRGDLSNFLKILEDALNCVAWVDDAQTRHIEMWLDDSDAKHPRVEIVVESIQTNAVGQIVRRGSLPATDQGGE